MGGPADEQVTHPKLYSLVRGPSVDVDEAREWVRSQVVYLEDRNLVVREPHPYNDDEQVVRVLRDDGSGELLDDPDGRTDRYVTLNGTLMVSGVCAAWDTPELVCYLADRSETKAMAILAGQGITAIPLPA